MATESLQGYKIQGIYYLNKRTHRIQQNVGGACPLLALCNTLFLNHAIVYAKGGRRIKFEELTACLTQHLQNLLTDESAAKTELEVDIPTFSASGDADGDGDVAADAADADGDGDGDGDSDSQHDDIDDAVHDIDIDDDDIDINNKSKSKPKSDKSEKQKSTTSNPKSKSIKKSNKNHDEKDKEDIDNKEEKKQDDVADDNEKKEEKEDDKRTKQEKEIAKKIEAIEECIKLFPKLEEGLDINIKFSDACDFEENPGYRMFNSYGFKLFHGWVVDPKNERLHQLVGEKSYDETIDFLISDPDKNATEEEKKALEDDKDVVRKFFNESATQLTAYGLTRLYALINVEDELNIFFRNNHFSTIVKHQGILYEFVTDEGIVDADPQITWQTLLQISGDEQFVNNKFQSIHTNISQYTQLAQYNRMKFAQDNNLAFDGTNTSHDASGHNLHEHPEEEKKYPSDSLIGVLNTAIDYIDGESFVKPSVGDDDDDATALLAQHHNRHIQRSTDTFDKYMIKDYVHGIPLRNPKHDDVHFQIRSFELTDAEQLLRLLTTTYAPYKAMQNIDFMHDDNTFALVLEMKYDPKKMQIKLQQQQQQEEQEKQKQQQQEEQEQSQQTDVVDNGGIIDDEDDIDIDLEQKKQKEQKQDFEEKKEEKQPLQLPSSGSMIIGYVKYDWNKFNFWDWRESDWEDYDIEQSVYGNNRYEKQKQLRECGVRTESFVRILDVAMLPDYFHHGLGSQLLTSLVYAFPSGTRFGAEVATNNTAAVKCFTKIRFIIARMESYCTKYKMTLESEFTISEYQQFLMNSVVTQTKTISTSKAHQLQQQQEAQSQQKTDDFKDKEDAPTKEPQQQPPTDVVIAVDDDDDDMHGRGRNTNIDLPDNMQRAPRHGGDPHHDPHPHAQHAHAQPEDVTMHHDEDIHHQQHDYDSDHMGHQHHEQDMLQHHGGGHGGGGGGGVDNMFFYQDNFVRVTLDSLGLNKYYHMFHDLQITQHQLPNLEMGLVEYLISDKNDRDKFMNWFSDTYGKQQEPQTQQQEPQSHPPQQQEQDDHHQPSDDDPIDDTDAHHHLK